MTQKTQVAKPTSVRTATKSKVNWQELTRSKEFWCIASGIILATTIFVAEIVANHHLRNTANAVRSEDIVAVPTEGWSDKYLEYLNQIIENKHSEDERLNLANMQSAEVSLHYQPAWFSPVMTIAYYSTINDKPYTAFIATQEGSNGLVVLNLPDQYDIRHYYNMIDRTANYYTIESGVNPAFSCFVPLVTRTQQGSADSNVDGAICTVYADTEISHPADSKASYYLFDEVFIPLKETKNSFELNSELSAKKMQKAYEQLITQLGIIQAYTNQELTQIDSRVTAAQERASE